MATPSAEYILAFAVIFEGLESITPLMAKLQKWHEEVCEGQQMIDSVVEEQKNYRDDVNN